MNWLQTLSHLRDNRTAHVLVTVLETRGSSPRGAGAKMIICADEIHGTIGGGTLEHRIMERSRAMISAGESLAEIMRISLGASTGQCCGGEVTVFLEPWIRTSPTVAVFGAGHVGKELIQILQNSQLPIVWLDSREEYLPLQPPEGVSSLFSDAPEEEIEDFKEGVIAIILTHSHALDQKICERLLKWGKAGFIGLIGSETKKKRFQTLLMNKGFSEDQIENIECPVGVSGVGGKLPRHIAISIAARILQVSREFGQVQEE
jgi:xanthine dehydrogenase accessory factor